MSDPLEADLAPYAVRSSDCGGRAHREPDDHLRTPFELDCHRILECTAFRRLEGKTQVFAPSHHDHFRTRLTHTIEAARIARTLARSLRANESLCEAITLAHDLGHPPFGHAGEAALDEAMSARGGFNHNAQSVRVVEYLEHPFPAFRGLNLTAQTRAGMRLHTTRYDSCGTSESALCDEGFAGPSVEAQIVSMADRIAYNCHDLEDAIGAGFISLTELAEVAAWQDAFDKTVGDLSSKPIHAIRRVVLDSMLDSLLSDVIEVSRGLLASVGSLDQVLGNKHVLVVLSPSVEERLVELEQFLIDHLYRRPEVAETDLRGRETVLALFDAYRAKPDALPTRFAARIDEQGKDRVICDYIAGMTDRLCVAEHARLVGP